MGLNISQGPPLTMDVEVSTDPLTGNEIVSVIHPNGLHVFVDERGEVIVKANDWDTQLIELTGLGTTRIARRFGVRKIIKPLDNPT